MKDDKDIINDALMARIKELEAEKVKWETKERKLNIRDYLLSQFVYTTRDSTLNDFAELCLDRYEDCADNYGYEDIEGDVIAILEDLSDGIDIANNDSFRKVFEAVVKLQINRNK